MKFFCANIFTIKLDFAIKNSIFANLQIFLLILKVEHKSRPICFCLVDDDFAVKYVNREDADHLIATIRKYYPMTVDEDATKYIGLAIQWDYTNQKAHIHMPGYLDKAFVRFNHKPPMTIQNSPHPHVPPNYGAKTQYAVEEIESPPLSKEDTTYVWAIYRNPSL